GSEAPWASPRSTGGPGGRLAPPAAGRGRAGTSPPGRSRDGRCEAGRTRRRTLRASPVDALSDGRVEHEAVRADQDLVSGPGTRRAQSVLHSQPLELCRKRGHVAIAVRV